MRISSARFFLLAAAIATFGCSGSPLSDRDLTRLCELQVRCSGGFVTQESCEASIRESRDQAADEGCALVFGAAARCAIRADECGTSTCADQAARLESCLDRTTERDSGTITVPDAGVIVTPSALRQNAAGGLEIFHDGTWLPICDDGFGMEEATVACRHLGFAGATSFSTISGETDAFWLDDVVCTGGETSLDQCSHGDWGSENCSASETQAVVCF